MFRDKVVTVLRRLHSASECGQTLVEYGLIVGLVAIAAVAGISLVAEEVGSLWGGNVTQIATAIAEVLGLG